MTSLRRIFFISLCDTATFTYLILTTKDLKTFLNLLILESLIQSISYVIRSCIKLLKPQPFESSNPASLFFSLIHIFAFSAAFVMMNPETATTGPVNIAFIYTLITGNIIALILLFLPRTIVFISNKIKNPSDKESLFSLEGRVLQMHIRIFALVIYAGGITQSIPIYALVIVRFCDLLLENAIGAIYSKSKM